MLSIYPKNTHKCPEWYIEFLVHCYGDASIFLVSGVFKYLHLVYEQAIVFYLRGTDPECKDSSAQTLKLEGIGRSRERVLDISCSLKDTMDR